MTVRGFSGTIAKIGLNFNGRSYNMKCDDITVRVKTRIKGFLLCSTRIHLEKLSVRCTVRDLGLNPSWAGSSYEYCLLALILAQKGALIGDG